VSKYPMFDRTLTQEAFSFPIVIGMTAVQKEPVLPHHHQFYEISIYVQGSAVDIVNGKQINSSSGTVICKLPHRIHETRPKTQAGYKKYNLMFDMDILLAAEMDSELKRFFHYSSDGDKLPYFQLNEQQLQLIEQLCIDIYREYESDHMFKESYIRSKLIEILVQLSRSQYTLEQGISHAKSGAKISTSITTSASNESNSSNSYSAPNLDKGNKANRALRYINSHFLMDLSLETLSAEFAVSAPYLSKMIMRITGKTFTDYVHTLRIEMACSLLISTKMSILDVSVESGYRSFKTFSRAFLQKKEMSPSKYRQQHLKNK